MSNRKALMLIAAFVALTLGSFIWYVATWEGRKGQGQSSSIILPQILPPEAPTRTTGLNV